jgi:hypothetical protein
VIGDIRRAIASGERRILVRGPGGPRRLLWVKRALGESGMRVAVFRLRHVRKVTDLDRAARQAGEGRDFPDAMFWLSAEARAHPVGIVFDDFDRCRGAPYGEILHERIWAESYYLARTAVVVLTMGDQAYAERCFAHFPKSRGPVCPVTIPAAWVGKGVKRKRP